MTTLDTKAAELIARKRAGGDCDQDESAWIKGFFDALHPINTAHGRAMADAYPLEKDEWFDEVERGLRPAPKPTEQLYNVSVQVVDLIWATSAEEAITQLSGELIGRHDLDVLDHSGSAFVSEAVESRGWDGERRVETP